MKIIYAWFCIESCNYFSFNTQKQGIRWKIILGNNCIRHPHIGMKSTSLRFIPRPIWEKHGIQLLHKLPAPSIHSLYIYIYIYIYMSSTHSSWNKKKWIGCKNNLKILVQISFSHRHLCHYVAIVFLICTNTGTWYYWCWA